MEQHGSGLGQVVAPADPPRRERWLPRLRHAVARRTRNLLAEPRRLVRLAIILLVLGGAGWVFGWRGYGWYQLSAGRQQLQRDHCRQAFDHFQASLSVWPDDPEVLILAARAARRSGDLDAAEQLLGRCQASGELADEAALERVLLRACRGEVDEVGDFCLALLVKDPPEAPLIVEALARGNLAALRLTEASTYLARWLERDPDHAQPLFLLGLIQMQAANQQEASRLFRRVVEIDPERDDARLYLAGLYLDMGQAREAMPHLEILRRRLAGNDLVEVRMARCLDLLGRQEEAVALLDAVLARHPHLSAALVERGKLAVRAGDVERAEKLLRTACDRDPGDGAAHYHLAQCLELRGKSAEARAVLLRKHQLEQDTERLRVIATVQMAQRPRDPALRAELGAIFLRTGAEDAGVRWLESALALDPGNADAHRALAAHYERLGQFSRAIRHRELAGPAPADPAKAKTDGRP